MARGILSLLDTIDHGRNDLNMGGHWAPWLAEPTTDGLVEVERATGDLVADAADDHGLAVAWAAARDRRRLPMRWVDAGLIATFERSVHGD